MRGRKNGCPTSVRDWQIDIHHPLEDRWVRVRGLNTITRSHDTTTEDGSAAESGYEEPYVTKRSGSLRLDGRPVVDEITGDRDAGQELLNDYATNFRCEGDALIRITDAYGHAMQAYYVVTGTEDTADNSGSNVSWDLAQVGEAETLPYKVLEGITLTSAGETVTDLTIDMSDVPRLISIVFEPEDASNRRYKVTASGHVVRVGGFGDNTFMLTPFKTGTGSVKVTTVSGSCAASFTVTVTDEKVPYKSGELGVGMLGAMVLGRSNLAS